MALIQITTQIKNNMHINDQFSQIANLLQEAGFIITHMEEFK